METIRKWLQMNNLLCSYDNPSGIIAEQTDVNTLRMYDDNESGDYNLEKVESAIVANLLTVEDFWQQIAPFERNPVPKIFRRGM